MLFPLSLPPTDVSLPAKHASVMHTRLLRFSLSNVVLVQAPGSHGHGKLGLGR